MLIKHLQLQLQQQSFTSTNLCSQKKQPHFEKGFFGYQLHQNCALLSLNDTWSLLLIMFLNSLIYVDELLEKIVNATTFLVLGGSKISIIWIYYCDKIKTQVIFHFFTDYQYNKCYFYVYYYIYYYYLTSSSWKLVISQFFCASRVKNKDPKTAIN